MNDEATPIARALLPDPDFWDRGLLTGQCPVCLLHAPVVGKRDSNNVLYDHWPFSSMDGEGQEGFCAGSGDEPFEVFKETLHWTPRRTRVVSLQRLYESLEAYVQVLAWVDDLSDEKLAHVRDLLLTELRAVRLRDDEEVLP